MSTITLGHYENTKMGGALIVAIALHFLVIGFFLHSNQESRWDELTPPPSVVMELSMEAEAKQLIEVNIGQVQEVSVVSKDQEATLEESELPPVPVNEKAEVFVTKTEKKKSQPIPKKEKKENKRVEEIESDNSKSSAAPATSDAAALKKTNKIAAEFNSNSQAAQDAEKQWQALVLGKLNKFKRYPDDARRRNRIGIPVIRFEVDTQGYVIKSSLVKESGTRSLDREAEKVLSRAQPLPVPPVEMIRNGKVTVVMPIDFTIKN